PSSARCACGPPPAPEPSQTPRRSAATPGRGAPGLRSSLLRLLVRRLLVAPRAVLLPLGPLGVLAPVLRREVVPALARGAFHDDVFARHLSSNALFQDLRDHAGADRPAALAARGPRLPLHRARPA